MYFQRDEVPQHLPLPKDWRARKQSFSRIQKMFGLQKALISLSSWKGVLQAWMAVFDWNGRDEVGNGQLRSKCGSWQEEYMHLHNNLRLAGLSNDSRLPKVERFLVYRCTSQVKHLVNGSWQLKRGPMGDCQMPLSEGLLGLASSFVVAVLTQRAFLVDWPALEKLFEPANVDWRVPSVTHLAVQADGELPAGHRECSWGPDTKFKLAGMSRAGKLTVLPRGESAVRKLMACLDEAEDEGVVELSGVSGAAAWLAASASAWGRELRAMNLQPPFILGCLLQFLLRPRRHVYKAIAPRVAEVRAPGVFSVCIHPWDSAGAAVPALKARQKDEKAHSPDSYETALACAENVADAWAPQKKLLVMSPQSSYTLSLAAAFQVAAQEWSLCTVADLFLLHDAAYLSTAGVITARLPPETATGLDLTDKLLQLCSAASLHRLKQQEQL